MTRSHVLLLKTPSTPTPITTNSRISITHLPLLSTNFNQQTITRLSSLFQDDTQQWDGVVLCSQRAVQAYEMILTSQQGRKRIRPGVHFVVGKQTRTSLLSVKGLDLDEEDQVVGSESGNGQALANEIITYYSSSTSTGSIKLLFLCGDKTNESLPSILSSHPLPESEEGGGGPKISLDSHIVYSTCQSTKFEPDFLSYLHDKLPSTSSSSSGRIWLALCSPSGSQSLCQILRKHQLLPPSTSTGESEFGSLRDRLKFVAIGTTTKRYLEDREGVQVDAVAEVPGEEGLVRAVEEWEDAYRQERES
ncbi:hypothetical protein JCM5353_003158 [Sporobolomyces roseus]